MRVVPSGAALGARVEGLDLSKPLDAQTVEALKQAWRDHLVLVFPDQELTIPQQIAFSENFGEIMEHPMTAGMPAPKDGIRAEYREVLPVTATSNTNGWHTDISCMAVAPTFSLLHCKEFSGLEDFDSDTCFCNQYNTFESLSPGLKSFLLRTTAVHSARKILLGRQLEAKGLFSNDTLGKGGVTTAESELGMPLEQLHPVVRKHPETGRPAVYLDNANGDRFEGWTREESKPLLIQLVDIASREENVYRHKWKKGDLVCWDNRCTMHKGPPSVLFPKDAIRDMVRTTVIPRGEQRPQPFFVEGPDESDGDPAAKQQTAITSRL